METPHRSADPIEAPAQQSHERRAEERLTQLIKEHERPLYAFLHSLLADRSGVHECLQDTYMRAYLQLRKGGCVETAWLYRVGYNRAMDELRRRRRVVAGTVDESTSADPIDWRLMIEEGLGQVSHLDRQIIFLHAYAGFRTDEIGILLGISGPAVRQRLYRARQRIRRLYKRDG